MKYIFFLTIFFFTIFGFSQVKDKRAELDVEGRINEISVSPDGKIWLVTAVGKTYYCNHIDSVWHYGKPIYVSKDEFYNFAPILERISFFNKDTAIITGHIIFDEEDMKHNGYYYTKDAGETWELRNYNGDSWIYTIYSDKNGNAWMGGLFKELYFSNDFGITWKTKKLRYKLSDRTYGIFMSDAQNGVASSDANEILITKNNWKTTKRIKTPFDQLKFKVSDRHHYWDTRISKIIIWKNYIVVNQNGHFYYSDKDLIEWKKFPVKIVDFELDIESQLLYVISDSLKIYTFSDPLHSQLLKQEKLSSFPIDIKVSNGSLFIITNNLNVYKISKDEMKRSMLYTSDHAIPEPEKVVWGKKVTWGANGNHLYILDKNDMNWYRENVFDFEISSIFLQNDSVAILWDGVRNNYIYSLNNHSCKIYNPKTPLQSFLSYPVKSFTINAGSAGCFHNIYNLVTYEKVNDSTFTNSKISYNDHSEDSIIKNIQKTFKYFTNTSNLTNILATINLNISAMPTFNDFQITEQDKNNYIISVDELLKREENENIESNSEKKEFYYSIVPIIDSLGNIMISELLNQQEQWYSTTSNWFTIQIINENNDTIKISRDYYVETLPWNLPWKFEYKGQWFNCYSIDFSRFIDSCIPEIFIDKEVFDNKVLIMSIADYLWNKKQKKERFE